ncbi:MAG TPA: class I SAM-dependent methyltransferase [Streptosporangiaceae bacterium]|nr:class I SAM-dependent methyltransferase [Streptosporangiaceae bacterium]
MSEPADTNAELWQSQDVVAAWAADAARRERSRTAPLEFLAGLLPFGEQDAFTFLDLGAGTGAASRTILARYPRSTALLADFSAAMMSAGERELRAFTGRYRYVEFDMSSGEWPAAIPAALNAVVTSMCVHHLPDERKRGLFREILGHLVPGGWYLNFDPVRAPDPAVEAAWTRVADQRDPEAAARRRHRTPQEQARWDNHVRYLAPLNTQLGYLRSAGFAGIDVYWKNLENVIYGGCRPGEPQNSPKN